MLFCVFYFFALSCFCDIHVVLRVLSKIAIILLRKREQVLLISVCRCLSVFQCLVLMVPCVGLWSVILAFPGHTYLFCFNKAIIQINKYKSIITMQYTSGLICHPSRCGRKNNVVSTSMRRHCVASTLVRRCFDVR